MAKTKKNKNLKHLLRTNRAVMGMLRKSHFESGGDLASWRGRKDIFVDRKKERSKLACRKKYRVR